MATDDLLASLPERGREPVDFSWSSPGLETLPEQPQTAVYLNPVGQLVIRQMRDVYEDDPYVFFEPDRVPRLLAMIQKVMSNG